MAITESIPVNRTRAYQRPYKTRQQRRTAARNKVDDNSDHKFLVKVLVGAAIVVLLATGFAVKGMADRESATAKFPTTEGQ